MPPQNSNDPVQDTSTDDTSRPSEPVTNTSPASETTTPQTTAPAETVSTPNQHAPKSGWSKKRKLFIGGLVAAVLILGGSAAAYLGVVVPNQPDNVWKTALDRTAAGYDRLVDESDEAKDIKGYDIDGNYKFSGAFSTDGTIQGHTNGPSSVFTADVGAVTTRINAELRLIDSPSSKNPDIYVKATGLKGIGAAYGLGEAADGIDNQWYVIDHTFLDNVEAQATQGSTNQTSLTTDEIRQIAIAVGEVNKQYLFTTDEDKAVLRVVKQVGREEQDGRSVYHYKIGLDKAHTKQYLTALTERLQQTPLTKLLEGKSVKDAVQLDDILKQVDSYKESDTADVYVDLQTKLIRTIKFTDSDNPKNYLQLGLHYTGGDQVPFVVSIHTDEEGKTADYSLKIDTNTETNVTDLVLNFDAALEGGNGREKGAAKVTVKPNDKPAAITKPDGAKSLNELLAGIMSGIGSELEAEDLNLEAL